MSRENRPTNPFRDAPKGPLETLLNRADQHQWLESLVMRALPPALAESCRFAGCKNGEMTILVPDSTRATQVRFQQRAMLRALREDERFSQVWRIRIRVQPWFSPAPRRSTPPPRLSEDNARLLREEAEHTEDEALRDVLLRLSSHAR